MLRFFNRTTRTKTTTTMQRDEERFCSILIGNCVRQTRTVDVDNSYHGAKLIRMFRWCRLTRAE